jgi:hypothetical protein
VSFTYKISGVKVFIKKDYNAFELNTAISVGKIVADSLKLLFLGAYKESQVEKVDFKLFNSRTNAFYVRIGVVERDGIIENLSGKSNVLIKSLSDYLIELCE